MQTKTSMQPHNVILFVIFAIAWIGTAADIAPVKGSRVLSGYTEQQGRERNSLLSKTLPSERAEEESEKESEEESEELQKPRGSVDIPKLHVTSSLDESRHDIVVVVAPSIKDAVKHHQQQFEPLDKFLEIDDSATKRCFIAPVPGVAGGRVVFSSTGLLDRDIDDVRRYGDAAKKGIERALQAGATSPLLVIVGTKNKKFSWTKLVSILGTFEALYVPLEERENKNDDSKKKKVKSIGIFETLRNHQDKDFHRAIKLSTAIEKGRTVSRNIGGSDPKTMTPAKVEKYVAELFKHTDVKVDVIKGFDKLKREYPMFAAVDRAANEIEEHRGRVIWLTYEPKGPVNKTLMMVGKGVVFDTGGANIKTGGGMLGMNRDKNGAGIVAGFMKIVSQLKPKGLKVVAAMPMVVNSIGPVCLLPGEIITSRSGQGVRIISTDAEGRLEMGDVLAHMSEKAVDEVDPHLMTFATLTGHARRAVGPYSVVMDNGPAKEAGMARSLYDIGDKCGDPFEISTLRRDDYHAVWDESKKLLQNSGKEGSSIETPRGHQMAMAFLQMVSGLDKHQTTDKTPLKYTHFDIAGSTVLNIDFNINAPTLTALTLHCIEHY